MKLSFILSFLISTFMLHAQTDTLPYYEIPPAPENYTANAVLARTIDGLGYRYYWATEGLTAADLEYTPGNHGRKTEVVLEHLNGLSEVIRNAVTGKPNVRPRPERNLTQEEKRAETLHNLKAASDYLRSEKRSIEECKVTFQRGSQTSDFPVWNLLNGPLADALYHVGQIVSYRRSAGNPMNPNVNVFSGKTGD